MTWINILFIRLRGLFRRDQVIEDIHDELRFHVEMETQVNVERGMSPDEARLAALKTFGNVGRIRDLGHEIRGGGIMDTVWQDLRYGIRTLLRNPAFTVVAVATLALGIGANTVIFDVISTVLLRQMPYIDSEKLVVIESGDRTKGTDRMGRLSPGNYWSMRNSTQSFEEITGFMGSGHSFKDKENPETVPGVEVTPSFFKALRARPHLGRTIEERDTCNNCQGVMVLSHRLWMRRFGGDPNIVGTKLVDSGIEVVGVMPPDFKYPAHSEVWQPLPHEMQAQDRASRYFQVYGLLKPGVTLEHARSELQLFAARYEEEFPKENKNLGFALTPFRDRLTRDVRTSLFILLGAVGCVLLIACANVANLLLARAVARRRDLAIRAALGASRWRLIRQILIESFLLTAAGTIVGCLLAVWARVGLLSLLPRHYSHLQLGEHLQFDWRVLLFTLSVMLVTALIFGLMPAWQVSGPEAGDFMKERQHTTEGVETRRVRSLLVMTEVSLAVVLLVSAGLLLNSFLRLRRVELGFDPQNVFAVRLSTPHDMTHTQKSNLIDRLQEAVASVLDVESAAVTSGSVFPFLHFPLNRVDKPLPADESVLYDAISSNYFATLRGALLKGRYFNGRDTEATEAVGIINEMLARKYFPGEDPLDKKISLNYLGKPQERRVVGVVRDMSQGQLVKVEPQVFVPFTQQTWFSASLVVRARTSAAAANRSVQSALWSIDATQPVSRLQTAEGLLGENLDEPRLYTVLLGLFAGLSLMLAIIGIAGVMSYNVTQRTHEIGVRVALGATAADVLRLVVGQGMRFVLVGVAIGLLASLALTRLMKGLLFGVSTTDPTTFVVIPLLLAAVALVACLLPARRATKVDPVIALRYD